MTYNVASVLNNLAIIEAFLDLPDARRGEGKRHDQALCLALFTLSISAGCKGFLAISDWLLSYRSELIELFNPAKSRLPSYSTIRRVLLNLDYKAYSNCLAQFFQIDPVGGETIAMDGKVLRGSYNPHSALQFLRQTLRFICYSFENQIRRQKTNLVEVENYV